MPQWFAAIVRWIMGLFKRPARHAPVAMTCIDFSTMPAAPPLANPLVLSQVEFTPRAPGGAALQARIWSQGGYTGLDCDRFLELAFPKSKRIEATLVHFAPGGELEAVEDNGATLGPVTMTAAHTVQTLVLTGTDLYRGSIKAQANETILIKFCYEQ